VIARTTRERGAHYGLGVKEKVWTSTTRSCVPTSTLEARRRCAYCAGRARS